MKNYPYRVPAQFYDHITRMLSRKQLVVVKMMESIGKLCYRGQHFSDFTFVSSALKKKRPDTKPILVSVIETINHRLFPEFFEFFAFLKH